MRPPAQLLAARRNPSPTVGHGASSRSRVPTPRPPPSRSDSQGPRRDKSVGRAHSPAQRRQPGSRGTALGRVVPRARSAGSALKVPLAANPAALGAGESRPGRCRDEPPGESASKWESPSEPSAPSPDPNCGLGLTRAGLHVICIAHWEWTRGPCATPTCPPPGVASRESGAESGAGRRST
uniref:Uncharacterized protein n=1 Tax=Rangifer tarandus platyrhynchus TaxID=3082113 RepID=A0ACB0FA22_RANTA|nr:unnamed protein product [Rangifer tarandus platyrhynchus]